MAAKPLPMTSSANICVGCGICCDGHLFDYALIKPEEQSLCAELDLEVRLQPESVDRFLHPCPRFADGCCTVYDRRPSTCRTFRCRLLQDHDAGRVTTQEAEAIIAQVHALDWHGTLRLVVEELVPGRSGGAANKLALALQAVAASPDPAALRRRHGTALVRAAALILLLRNHFRSEEPGDTAGPADGAKAG